MKRPNEPHVTFDVRTKLLVMLALLSLPVLVLSIIQLRSHQRSITEQATLLTRIETAAAGGALLSWLEDHPEYAGQEMPLAQAPASDLYRRIQQQASLDEHAVIAVINAWGRTVENNTAASPLPVPSSLPSEIHQHRWSDGIVRITGAKRVGPFGWSVAIGVPLAEDTPAGRSVLMLTATWALALIASILLAIWAVGRFTKPLRQLVTSASLLGEGQLDERADVETDDEIGTLAKGFNVMAASLQTKFDELQTQGAFIEEVLDSLPLGVAVLDQSLIVRKANSTFARFVGREDIALAGRGLYEAAAGLAVLSEVVEDVRRTRRAFVNYGLPLELVSRDRQADEGTKFWDVILWPTAESSEERGDLILILSEVSKRVRAEKLATAAFAAEKARAAELESVINQMDEGVVIVDGRGRYRINPAAAIILGRNPGEFRDGVEALIADLALRDMDGRELAAQETPLGRALEHGERVSGEQFKIVRSDGEGRVLDISATPLINDTGDREGAVAVFRDITEEARQHTELVDAYDRLREHDRLKSAFVATVSHELRTPLNVIIGLCQLLERDRQQPLAPLQNEAIVRMGRNARSLLEHVNDLLDYSRLEAGRSALNLESVEIAEVAAAVLEDFSAEAREKNIELQTNIAADLGPITTDRHKLAQVLSNLMSNAVKFTSVGAVRLTAAPLDEQRWYIEVNDTGIGISNDALTYIFDDFRQVDDRLARSYSGVGLGLAITRKIVELLGGEITVESKQNEGSRFRITWPRVAKARTGTGSLLGEKRGTLVTGATDLRARA